MTRRQERRAERKAALLAIKLAAHCAVCGRLPRASGVALQFHHGQLRSDAKSFDIGSVRDDVSWDRVLEEIRRTLLLCSACHLEVHSGDIDLRHLGRIS